MRVYLVQGKTENYYDFWETPGQEVGRDLRPFESLILME